MKKTKSLDNGQNLCEDCIKDDRHCEEICSAELNKFDRGDFFTFKSRVIACEGYEKDTSKVYCPPPPNQMLLLTFLRSCQ